MTTTAEMTALRQNETDLRRGSLTPPAITASLLGYIFFLWEATGDQSVLLLLATGVLMVGGVGSYALRGRHLPLASLMLVLSMLAAVACAMSATGVYDLAYLCIAPVLYASVLLGHRAAFLVAILASVLVGAIASRDSEFALFSVQCGLPLVVVALGAIASWLSARNLRTALAWVWHGYEEAHRNECRAREGQAELRRVLKALDEATYRLERANHMLGQARDQAEEARRLKQQFAQTISHELRTPLNLIVSFTDLMIQAPEHYGGPLSAAYARDLGIVHRNACHLQSLVNDVLDLARIEAAQMSIVQEETDLQDLVREATNAVRSLAEVRGLALKVEVEPDLPRLWIDPVRIRQVLFNLLANSARFTEEGSITLGVARQSGQVLFTVADTGVGIAPEDMPSIFEEFRQVDGSTRRRHGGTGLGLAISKRFVELHGGRIWAESQVGAGSTFRFSLPVARRDSLAGAYESQSGVWPLSASPAPSEERIVLVVTRSPRAAALLNRYVRGCRVVVAQDLKHARGLARQLLPEAIIFDTSTRELDTRALWGLAEEWGLSQTPFVACPLPGEEPMRQLLAVDGYLLKPVSRESLWDVLRQLGEDIDKVLVVDDDRDFVRLVGRLLDNSLRRYQVVSAYSGREALEMVRYHQPDLVLLDMVLPDISGAQVIERLRAKQESRRLPIVVVSAQDEVDTIETVPGAFAVTKASGILPGDVVLWVQHVLQSTGQHPSAVGDQPSRAR